MTQPAPRTTLLRAIWHALTVVGVVLIVALMWGLVTYPRAIRNVLIAWVAWRVGRLVWYAFRHDARWFAR